MSILLAEELPHASGWVVLIVMAGVSAVAMLVCGAFARRDDGAVARLFARRPVGMLALNAGLSILAYLGATIVLLSILRARGMVDLEKMTEETIPPLVMILLSVMLPAVSLLMLVVGLRYIVPGGFGQVGLKRELPARAILPAIGFLVAVLPFIFLVSNLAEWFYQRIGMRHANEHPLLHSMDGTGAQWAKILASIAAVVLAPLSEEILFRGHIQTMLRSVLNGSLIWLRRIAPPAVFATPAAPSSQEGVAPSPPAVVLPYEPRAIAPPPELPVGPSLEAFWVSVTAVILTSLLFAFVHPGWTRPPIFVLSLFLGFAYERRGNLWTTIFMHAMFNGVMVLGFLFMTHPTS